MAGRRSKARPGLGTGRWVLTQPQPRHAEPRGQRLPGAGPLKRRLSKFTTNKLVNPLVRRLIEAGIFPRTHALLETTGRKSGLPRRIPIGNGLRGDTFWIVTEHGNAADYVKNIRQDANVRVKVGRRWLKGKAQILPEEDARQRLQELDRPVNDAMLKLVGTEMLVVRIDLEGADRDAAA
jgi:deazaflavin-dependent oxidoreductase (nitroreductase family)